MLEIENVRLLFEQSGTFKNAFKDMGYKSYDYDIQNKYGETDYIIDLFKEIKNAYEKKKSIFDNFNKNVLIIAFFPCTYFSVQNRLIYEKKVYQFQKWDNEKIEKYIIDRKEKREEFYNLFLMFVNVVKRFNLKTIIENPYTGNYLLEREEVKKPNIVIKDRSEYGDFFKKPTMFYFYNFEPTYMSFYTKSTPKKMRKVNDETTVNRSMIHPDFAFNFINKYVLGIN